MAKRTGVSPNAVRRRIAKGELKAIKGYGGYYIDTRKLSPMEGRS
jgi:DNA-binding Lrp family transcriptional regulator